MSRHRQRDRENQLDHRERQRRRHNESSSDEEDDDDEDVDGTERDDNVVVKKFEVNDLLISRRLPSLVEEDARLRSRKNNSTGCQICFNDIPFLLDGLMVRYCAPIDKEQLAKLDQEAEVYKSNNMLEGKGSVDLANKFNALFKKLNDEKNTYDKETICYDDEMLPDQVKHHYVYCKRKTTHIVNDVVKKLDKLANDIYNSEAMCTTHITRKTQRGFKELKYTQDQIKLYLQTTKGMETAILLQSRLGGFGTGANNNGIQNINRFLS